MGAYLFRLIDKTAGTVISETRLGEDHESGVAAAVEGVHSVEPSGPLDLYHVDTFYFAEPPESESDRRTARAAVAAYLAALRDTLRWRPPLVKELARGKAVIPNVYNNQGTLVTQNLDGTGEQTVATGLTLWEAQATDDEGIHGIGVRITFAKVSAAVD